MVQRTETSVEELLAVRPITEAIAMAVKAVPEYKHLEIVEGEWVGFERDEMTTGEEHGWIETILIILIGGYVLTYKRGRVYPGDVTFVLNGERGDLRFMREPDVAFIAAEDVEPTDGFIYRAPHLAVEIVSPSQSYEDMSDKMDEYFRFGTRQVWLVLPKKKRIEVHFPDRPHATYTIDQSIPG